MPHSPVSTGMIVTGIGVVPTSIFAVAVLAQEIATGQVDWANLGAVTAIIAMMGFLLTKLLPQMNQNNNETVKHLSDNHKQAMESQRKDLLSLVHRQENEKTAD